MLRAFLARRRARPGPEPCGPPIERIAAELRRLLWAHDSAAEPRRLRALETAIAHRATQAAVALGLSHPDGFCDRRQLRHLLRQLADEGLFLPRSVALMTP